MNLLNWLNRKKSRQHESLKRKIEELKLWRNFLVINKKPTQEIQKVDKEIIRLERKLKRKI